jgi:hypothetical protein
MHGFPLAAWREHIFDRPRLVAIILEQTGHGIPCHEWILAKQNFAAFHPSPRKQFLVVMDGSVPGKSGFFRLWRGFNENRAGDGFAILINPSEEGNGFELAIHGRLQLGVFALALDKAQAPVVAGDYADLDV